jgi:metal-responsive CopG/Arc/MetJ family transcriptional regulator
VSDSNTIGSMKQKVKTVPIYARIPESDVDELDRAANEELNSRSNMIARVIREWVRNRLKTSKK